MTDKEAKFTQDVYLVGEEKYDAKMLNEFIAYWTEPTPSGRKVRFEGQKYFHIGRRLATWARNDQRWIKKIEVNEPKTVTQKLRDKHGI